MNRQIKFRAWDKDENKFVKGVDISLGGVTTYPYNDSDLTANVILMQFTGLLDKNGIEIYEGDVLRWNDSRNLEVRWGSVGWVLYSDLFKSFGHPDGSTCQEFNTYGYVPKSEVIGNIYENPELLHE